MSLADLLQNILAALATVMNGIPQGLLALSYGFLSVPTAIGFFIGAAACGMTQSVAPVSFQAESIVLAGSVGKSSQERISMVIWAAILTSLLGLTGVMSWMVGFVGDTILSAMMAGVGFMLTKTAVEMFKSNRIVTATSVGTALIMYFFINKSLLWIVIVSMVVSSAVSNLLKQDNAKGVKAERAFSLKLIKPSFSLNILRGALALSCMTIGGNIAYGSVTASMTNGAHSLKVDALTIYSGLADVGSSVFGGTQLEAIISATAPAPQPVFAAVLMQLIMGLILILGLLPKMAKYIPSESISGFLFILGAFVTIPGNIQAAWACTEKGSAIIAAVTMTITAIFDPFFGMLGGVLVRALFLLGL